MFTFSLRFLKETFYPRVDAVCWLPVRDSRILVSQKTFQALIMNSGVPLFIDANSANRMIVLWMALQGLITRGIESSGVGYPEKDF
jgi:hypothetical protein